VSLLYHEGGIPFSLYIGFRSKGREEQTDTIIGIALTSGLVSLTGIQSDHAGTKGVVGKSQTEGIPGAVNHKLTTAGSSVEQKVIDGLLGKKGERHDQRNAIREI
jgi:hypothetical protein